MIQDCQNRSSHQSKDDNKMNMSIGDSIFELFEGLQNFQTPTKDHILSLLRLCVSDNRQFLEGIEQVYLKIFSTLSTSDQTIQTKVFQSLLQSFIRQLISLQIKQSIEDKVQNSFQGTLFFILQFLVEASKCFISQIRLMSLRILHIVLLDLSYNLQIDFEETLLRNLIDLVLFLLSLKSQICKQFAVKIYLALRELQVKQKELDEAVLSLMEQGTNEQTRKLVLLNFHTDQSNINRFLVRLNDKNSQISMLVFKKLKSIQTQEYGNYRQIAFENLSFDKKIKILIDGFENPNQWVKKQCVEYFVSQMKNNGDNQNQGVKIIEFKKSQRQPNNFQQQVTYTQQQISYFHESFDEYSSFIDQFEPDTLLTYPRFYKTFCQLLNRLMLKLPKFEKFIINLCQKIKKNSQKIHNFNSIQISSQIIFLSRVLSYSNKFKQVVFQHIPSFSEFAQLLQYFVKDRNIFGIHQVLQIIKITRLKINDQQGNKRIFQTLKRVLFDLNHFQSSWKNVNLKSSGEWELCEQQAKEYLEYRRFTTTGSTQSCSLSCSSLCIASSFDLILPIIQLIKEMRPQYYTDQIQYMIEDWSNPQSTTVFLEKDVAITAYAKIQASQEESINKSSLLSSLTQKIVSLSKKISQNNLKKILSIIALRGLNQKWSISPYLPLIKQQLSRDNQLYGLKMVGFYCQNIQNFELFFPLFWHHVSYFSINKLHSLLSIHIIVQLIIKLQIFSHKNKSKKNGSLKLKLSNRQDFTQMMLFQRLLQLIGIYSNLDDFLTAKALLECLLKLVYFNTFEQNYERVCLIHLILMWLKLQNHNNSSSQAQTNISSTSGNKQYKPTQLPKYKNKNEFFYILGLFFQQYMQKSKYNYNRLIQSFLILYQTIKLAKHNESKYLRTGIYWSFTDSQSMMKVKSQQSQQSQSCQIKQTNAKVKANMNVNMNINANMKYSDLYLYQSSNKLTLSIFQSLITLLDTVKMQNYNNDYVYLQDHHDNRNSINSDIKVKDLILLFGLTLQYKTLLNDQYFKRFLSKQIQQKNVNVEYLIFLKQRLQKLKQNETKPKYIKYIQAIDKQLLLQIKSRNKQVFNQQKVQNFQSCFDAYSKSIGQFAKHIYDRFQLLDYWRIVSESNCNRSQLQSSEDSHMHEMTTTAAFVKNQNQNEQRQKQPQLQLVQHQITITIKRNKYVVIPAQILLSTGVIKRKNNLDSEFIPTKKSIKVINSNVNSLCNTLNISSENENGLEFGQGHQSFTGAYHAHHAYSTRKRERLQFQGFSALEIKQKQEPQTQVHENNAPNRDFNVTADVPTPELTAYQNQQPIIIIQQQQQQQLINSLNIEVEDKQIQKTELTLPTEIITATLIPNEQNSQDAVQMGKNVQSD